MLGSGKSGSLINAAYRFRELPYSDNSQPLSRAAWSLDDIERENLELVRAYYRITDPEIRTRLRVLVNAVANRTQG